MKRVEFQTVDDGMTLEYRIAPSKTWRKFAAYETGLDCGRALNVILTSDYAFNAYFPEAIGATRRFLIHA